MNILFFTELDISPYTGGIERVTLNLVKELNARGHRCFLGYFDQSNKTENCDFQTKYPLEPAHLTEQIKSIILDNQINTCVVNISSKKYLYSFMPILRNLTRELQVRVVYGFYNMPGFELHGVNLKLAWYRLWHGAWNGNTLNGVIAYLAALFHVNGFIEKRIVQKLKVGILSDVIVLLSEKYIPIYASFIGDSQARFTAIGNPLSYPQNIAKESIANKEKIVLQVARFDDNFKRQTTALKIWKMVEKTGQFDDWKLIMVGYGQDEKYIKHTARKLKVKNVEFQGLQNPAKNLAKASIYINTSAFEGLPMILLDAQQHGVVPISFDSYAAVTDIIDHNRNGLIVTDNHLQEYAKQLMFLMSHKGERDVMAENGLESCQKFATDIIVDKWESVMKNDDYKNV